MLSFFMCVVFLDFGTLSSLVGMQTDNDLFTRVVCFIFLDELFPNTDYALFMFDFILWCFFYICIVPICESSAGMFSLHFKLRIYLSCFMGHYYVLFVGKNVFDFIR